MTMLSDRYFAKPHGRSREQSGFSLVELLTVIAIIAVLASLLLTSLVSAKKSARTVFCTSNLHQVTVALRMYLDESSGKRPSVDDLAAGKYLPSQKSFLCPEDKTGNWGYWAVNGGPVNPPPLPNGAEPVLYSYLLQPLSWSDAEWRQLVTAGSQAGVAACQLHGLGNQNTPDITSYSGLLLRAQLDGSVIRRQFFWTIVLFPMTTGPGINQTIGPNTPGGLMPLQIFFDDPANWQAYLQ